MIPKVEYKVDSRAYFVSQLFNYYSHTKNSLYFSAQVVVNLWYVWFWVVSKTPMPVGV